MQVSYIGYVTKDIKITSTTNNLSIKLAEDTETLDEVVVVGYGVQKKVNLIRHLRWLLLTVWKAH